MVKKIIIAIILSITGLAGVYAEKPIAPAVNCIGLPWCKTTDIENPWEASNKWDIVNSSIQNIISQMILYIWIIAVVAFMFYAVEYIKSLWDDSKVEEAKRALTYSIVWVIIAMSSYTVVNLLNEFIFTVNTEENETTQ